MSDNFVTESEDFEKVDPDNYQDENVTSTSMSGEMAEEDRYTAGTTPSNDVDLLGDLMNSEPSNEAVASAPLINFSTPIKEVEEPVKETKPVTTEKVAASDSTSCQSEGCWMKTVDPRDGIREMEGPSSSNVSESSAVKSRDLPSGQSVSGESTDNRNNNLNEKVGESDSSSVISSSDNEYSSSADESDTENSESAELDIGETEQTANGITVLDSNKELPQESITESEIGDTGVVEDIGNQNLEGLEEINIAMDVKEVNQDQRVPEMNLESEHESSKVSETFGIEDFGEEHIEDTTSVVESQNNGEYSEKLSEGAAMAATDNGVELINKNLGMSEEDMLSIIDKLTKDDETDKQLPEFESDVAFGSVDDSTRDRELEMFVKGEEVSMDSASPVVSDEVECDSLDSKSGSDRSESASGTGSEDNSCSDSDVSGDEAVIGMWSPSPLYGESEIPGDDDGEEDEGAMEVEEQYENVLPGYKYSGARGSNINKDEESLQQESELTNLRADVKGLMEEMELIVHDTETEEPADFLKSVDMDDSVNGAEGVEDKVPEVIATREQLTSIMSGGTRERSKTPEGELLHVKFQTPTNTLFYDPECPIVEKVALEVSDELIDHDEINDSETSDDVVSELEVKVVEDLKEVFQSLEAQGKIEGAMDLIKEAGITNMDDIALQFAQDVIEQARSERLAAENEKNKLDHENENTCEDVNQNSMQKEGVEQSADVSENIETSAAENMEESEALDEEPVVLRRKKGNREEAEMDSMIIHDLDTPRARESYVIGDIDALLEQEGLVEGETVLCREKADTVEAELADRDLIDSMIIHDLDTPETKDNFNVDNPEIANEKEELVINVCDKPSEEIPALTSENEAIPDKENAVDETELNHFKVGLDEVEVRHRRLSSGNIEEPELEHKTYADFEAGIVFETYDEQESSAVFNENRESEILATENKEIDSEFTENVTENSKPDSEIRKKEVPLVFSQRASDFMRMIMSEVLDLIYWRDLKKTGVVFGSMMFVLLSLTFFTILSVLAYLSLAILTVTLSFRVYKNVMQAVQKTNDGHPFKKLLELDIGLQSEVVENAADKIATNVNNCSRELRRLFLVEDYVDSLKFGLLLWFMTYVGSWFNGMTLVILAVVCIFTLPKVYETYQGPIDQNVNLVRGQLNNILKQVSSKIPFPKKKAKQQ